MVGCACTAYNVDCERGPIVKMTDKSYRVIFEGKLTPLTPILVTMTSWHPVCENKAIHHTTLISHAAIFHGNFSDEKKLKIQNM